MTGRKGPSFTALRSYVLLIAGLAVIGWEVIAESSERPTIIIAALLMMGVSVPLNLDAKAKGLAAAFKQAPEPEEPVEPEDAP